MAEALFYRLSSSPIESALPDLLERALARGWRVLIRVGSEGALSLVDDLLWTYRDDSFLPHGTVRDATASRHPILLTTGRENANGADVLMLLFGARANPEEMSRFVRACLVFDGADGQAVADARDDWRAVVAAGLPAKFWAQEDGRWVQKS